MKIERKIWFFKIWKFDEVLEVIDMVESGVFFNLFRDIYLDLYFSFY